jgi:ATP-dependent Clp protease adaptor protein ClpS
MPYRIMGIKLKDNSKTQSRKDERLKEPRSYTVILLNDNYTTREFVVEILKLIFHKNHEEATRIMLSVHRKGRGAVGIYTWDIAVTKAMQVHDIPKQHEFPLQCVVEEV